jgi:hypothetical protein
LEAAEMKRFMVGLFCVLMITGGCAGNMTQIFPNTKENLIENLSRDLSEVNLIVENARKEYKQETLKFRIIDAWSLAKEKQVQMIGSSQAKIYNVVQKSTIEIQTTEDIIVDVSKIQEGNEKSIGVVRTGRIVAFNEPAQLLAETGGYPIKLYDPALDLDDKAIEAITQYVMLTSKFEKTASIILKKVIEIQEKYKDSTVSIEQFSIHFPQVSIDIQFRFNPF